MAGARFFGRPRRNQPTQTVWNGLDPRGFDQERFLAASLRDPNPNRVSQGGGVAPMTQAERKEFARLARTGIRRRNQDATSRRSADRSRRVRGRRPYGNTIDLIRGMSPVRQFALQNVGSALSSLQPGVSRLRGDAMPLLNYARETSRAAGRDIRRQTRWIKPHIQSMHGSAMAQAGSSLRNMGRGQRRQTRRSWRDDASARQSARNTAGRSSRGQNVFSGSPSIRQPSINWGTDWGSF
jgi:hypothetical protein